METELWLLWATLAVSLLYYLSILRRGTGASRLPPGPRPLPIVGNLLDLRGHLHHTLARLARAHGPVMRVRLGLTTAVVVSSRDAAGEAFAKHDRRLAARAVPDAARALGFSERSMIWLPSSDPRWKALRGLVAAHVFSPRSLAAVRGVRERKVRDLVGYLRGRAGREVDVGQAVYGGVLNLVSSAFFSIDVVDVGAESAQGLRELVEAIVEAIAKPNVSDLIPFLRPLDLQGWRRYTAGRYEEIFRVLDGIIDRRLAEASSSRDTKYGDFLDALLELLSTGKVARDDLTTILFDVFAAGSDTIAITVEWAMAELLRNPSTMAKVRAELDGAFGSKETVEEPDAASLPYLQAVVKEAMRLHPVAPILLPHLAAEDGVEVGGYTVPKGSTVIFNAWAIMRDPGVWERPDEFLPERFLDEAAGVEFRGKDFEFIPFGAGRRLCPGLLMAERVVPHIVASLLHGFDWRLPEGVSTEQLDLSEKFTTVNVLAVPLRAVPLVRT
ncbi:hypothetical protein PAHAL_6G231300 [Panicum hallii]|jgi:cytochrome P450|uniref:Uncharacterized protein n=1 Tax=Panicum hallii TaxID=206008 RepID=A0A2S3I341_9POAL|nr:cytochrome P450 76M5-like [Panicum hallii]PAN35749.1 hypothetical protein PAHAL_6G231300 [Panicum hallii]